MTFEQLPKLTAKETKCLLRFFANNENQTEAYKFAYDCSNMSDAAIRVEASRFFKNPNITLWLDYYRKNRQKAIDEEFAYTIKDAFRELNELQKRSSEHTRTYNVESKCIENKCRLAGLFDKENPNTNVNVGISVPSIKVNGKDVEFIVGENE